MKIIVHMGQGKTGTTALQESFSAAARGLRTAKVLYPNFNDGVAHHLLLALHGNPERLPRWTHDRFGGTEGTILAAQTAWNQTLTAIEHERPDVLVLSSEYLINEPARATRANLGASLATLSSDITPVIYIRHPVDHYRSRLQQWLKHRGGFCQPIRDGLQNAIKDTEAAFSRRPEILAFDRKTLHGGDIVEDFASRFLAPWVAPHDLPRVEANVSLSAEALVVIAQLRAELGGTYEAAREVNKLFRHLKTFDKDDPPEHALTLRPDVAEVALRSATSIRWLVETGQVHIPDLDIHMIDGAPVPDWMRTAPPETLFLQDPERLKRMRSAIDQIRAKETAANQGPSWLRRPARSSGTSPKGGLRDRLMQRLMAKLSSLQRP